MDGVTVILAAWGAGVTAAVVFLLWKVDELVGRQAAMEALMKRNMENQAAFAAMVERAAARVGVKKAKPAKGK